MEETRWLSYDALAAALKITPDSARRLVARRRWPRKSGNDGRALIAVPADRLPPDAPPGGLPDTPPDTKGDISPPVSPIDPPDNSHLTTKLGELQERVAALTADLRVEQERSANLAALMASETAALRALLEVEKGRGEELRTERDRWALQAERLATPSPLPASSRSMWWPFKRAG